MNREVISAILLLDGLHLSEAGSKSLLQSLNLSSRAHVRLGRGIRAHTCRPLAGPLQAHVTLPSTIIAGVTSSSPPSETETSVAKKPPSIAVPVTIQIVVNEVNDDLSISNPCVTTVTLPATNTPIETNYMMPRKPAETTNPFLRKQDGRREDLPILICNKRANPAAGTATSVATHIDNAATVITWSVEIVDSMATNRNTVNQTVSCITDCPFVQRVSYRSAHAGLRCAWFPFWYFVSYWSFDISYIFILYCLLYAAMMLRIVWKSNMLHAWYLALYFIELTFYYVETLYFNIGYVCYIL